MEAKENMKKKEGRMGLYVKIVALLTVIGVVLSMLTTFIMFPTEQHRQVSKELISLNTKAFNQPEGSESVFDSDEYKALVAKDETKYTDTAGWITLVATTIISISVIGLTYNYLRKNHVTPHNKALGTAVVLLTVSSVLASVLAIYPTSALAGTTVKETFSEGLFFGLPLSFVLIVGFIFTVIFSLLINFVIVYIFERIYNKKHSFVVE